MAEFKLGRIRFVWKNEWQPDNTYYKDDVVSLGGKAYICVIGHTSAADFFTDLEVTPSKWNLVSDGQTWKGEWSSDTDYIVNDIVQYGGRLYIANTAHTSAEDSANGLEADQTNWDLFAEGLDWKGAWTTSEDYKINDFVKYGGTTYVCIEEHISASSFDLGLENDSTKWQVFNEGFEYLQTWEPNYRYKKNDVVKYGAGLWIAVTAHTSTAEFEIDLSNWEKFVEGFQYESEWNAYKEYQTGDIVQYGGNQYVAISDNQGEFPSTATTEWQLFSQGLKFVGDWNEDSSLVEYRVGEVVRLGGFTYRCIQDHSNEQPPNQDFWQRLNSGFEWRADWVDGAEYYEGDVVRFGDNSYVAVSYHIADDGVNSPDIADSSNFWSVLAIGTEQSVLTTTGDLVYYSGSAPVRLPVGQDGQILQVSNQGIPEWSFLDAVDDVYYVTEFGADQPAPVYGKSIDRPWRSIRYACQQIENGARNPDVRQLLELNRRFIQREVLAWIEEQIENGTTPFTTDFTFNSQKCERDVGLIIDAVAWDISHGGNVRSRKAAIEYVDNAGTFYTLGQEQETVAAINYAVSVMQDVIEQTDPDVNYQELRGDNSTRIAEQYKDSSLQAEDGVYADVQGLVQIITNAITAGNSNNIPRREIRNTLIKVSTGTYREVLPIIVPAECCILGDELRSTRVEPRKASNASLTPRSDFKYSFEALDRIEQIVGDIVEGTSVSETVGNTVLQKQDWPIAEVDWVAPQVKKLARSIRRQIDEKIGDKLEADLEPHYNLASPEFGRGKDLIELNTEFLKAEIIAFVADQAPELYYSKTKCKEDVSYILDAIGYDLIYGGNWQSVQAGNAYYEGSVLQIDSSEKSITLSAYNYLNEIAKSVATNATIVSPYQTEIEQVSGIGGNSAVATAIDDLFGDIAGIIDNGAGTVSITYPTVTDSDANAVISAIDSAKSQIQADSISFINTNFPDLDYDQAKCERDISLILDAAKYDLALSTNFATIVAAYAYLRKSGKKVLNSQKQASLANFEFVRLRTLEEVPTGTQYDFARTAITKSFEWLDDVVFGGSAEGSIEKNQDIEVYNAIHQLRTNREFIVQETLAYVDDYFSDTVTTINTDENTLVVSSTEWLDIYMPIRFTVNADSSDSTNSVINAGLDEDAVYYVYDIVSDTEFKLTAEPQGTELALSEFGENFSVQKAYEYSESLCARDVREYLDSIIWDLEWPQQWQRSYTGVAGISDFEIYRPASYRHRYAARYYANSVIGSQEEDMYYFRNGTGLRFQTVAGLDGDLGPLNEYGTRRPTAGAYCSLDPGWGPADERVWITERSPYVQNVTTFGHAAVGQKIDGDLHDGGNDSIVSNDFTQVISDGIGAWITNNGRAELVSVFSYYAHIGYLAETGGRIRATNGNNSYGTFGSVAEGVDPEETPVSAVVDNKSQFNATISNVYTDGDALLVTEFDHAGNNYTEAQIDFFGAGINEQAVADEFRDDSVYRVRIDEVNDSSGTAGGSGYTIISNTAQQGSLTGIFLAATDGAISSAYPGMKIYITGGAGRGQYAVVDTYNAGSKEATVVKEDGTAGWEHVVPGTEIVAPNSTSVYQIEPRIEIAAPAITDGSGTIGSGTYSAVEYCETSDQYTAVATSTSDSGTGLTFDVIRVGSKYYLSINQAGSNYARLDTAVIDGTDLDGASSLNDVTVTVTSVDESGSVIEFDFEGYGQKGVFVALPSSGTGAQISVDAESWSNSTLSDSENWTDLDSGLLDDGSTLIKPDYIVAVAQGGRVNWTSDKGTTWNSASTGLTSADDQFVAFGNVAADDNRFVVINSSERDVAYSQDGGANWTVTANALPSTGYTALAYGKGVFLAIKAASQEVAYSEDGVSWTQVTSALPSDSWTDVAWGNGRFIAVAASGESAYSLDGTNWTQVTLPDAATRTYRKIAYGQGVFAVTRDDSTVAHSQFGLDWDTHEMPVTTSAGYNAIAHGNPDRTTRFAAVSADSPTTEVAHARIGAQALARVSVSNEQIFEVRLLEPGSGYATDPATTVTDPNNIDDVILDTRIGKGSLANPTYVSRGTGYSEASAEINAEESNGEADFFQDGDLIAVKRLSQRPVDGSNIEFASLPGRFFRLVNTLSFVGTNDGSYTAFLQVSPALEIDEAPADEDEVTIRIRYSQVRLTGHDFLDIGTGNFEETNYPNEPLYRPDPLNETRNSNGGRVFFTSTDQDGNFRVGDLFSIEQSTGVASINADAFNLAGLQELSLGEVTLGGNSATINEFSTDPFFTANSDNVVPTQRAVKSYIEAQIGGGGASLNVNSVTAGDIFVGGNQITTVSGEPINIQANIVYEGTVLGIPLAYHYYLR